MRQARKAVFRARKLPCPACELPVEQNARQCPWCGHNIRLSPDGQRLLSDYHECPNCGHLNERLAVTCARCLTKLLSPCPACEGLIRIDEEICPSCGVDIKIYRKKQDEKREEAQFLARQRQALRASQLLAALPALFVFFILAVLAQEAPEGWSTAFIAAALASLPLVWYAGSKILALIMVKRVR